MSNWINVNDKLPLADFEAKGEEGILGNYQVHLCHQGDLNELSNVEWAGYLTGHGWCYVDGTPYPENVPWTITHWQPLDLPPTPEEMAQFLNTDREREVYQKDYESKLKYREA